MRSTRIGILVTLIAAPLAAQTPSVRSVSLEDAIRLADRSSETVELARAAVTRASGQQMMARSLLLPQLNASATYNKTLASQFDGFSLGGGSSTSTLESVCAPNIPAGATAAQRQAALDASQSCSTLNSGSSSSTNSFQKVGFGALNQWTLGLQFSQSVFTGGKFSGQRAAASAGRTAADIELTAQRAQLILDVTQAYYNTSLARRLEEIAVSALAQNDEILRQTTQARQVGSSSEFDLLRAQVARDNQVPVVLQRRSDRNVAELRLKQLLELPLDDSLQLTSSIDEAQAPVSDVSNLSAKPDTSVENRATVREAQANVQAQEGLLRSARADHLPSISITSGYQRLWFPTTVMPEFNDYRENWTVGVSASVSLFSGGRVSGNARVAEAGVREARARLKQSREFAALDSRVALNQLAQAEAMWRASQGTAEQARRALSIDQIRYKEGISTQTDLTQSQILLEQALVNRAVAARDLAVARMRLALLKDLPLSGAPGAAGGASSTGNVMSTPPQQTPQPRTSSAGSASGSSQ